MNKNINPHPGSQHIEVKSKKNMSKNLILANSAEFASWYKSDGGGCLNIFKAGVTVMCFPEDRVSDLI